jgi:hypothetical protein
MKTSKGFKVKISFPVYSLIRAYEGKKGNTKKRISFFEERLNYKIDYIKEKLRQLNDWEKEIKIGK